MNTLMKFIFVFLVLPNFTLCTLSKSDRKNNRLDKKINKPDKPYNEMFTKGYIGHTHINYRNIIEEHNSFSMTQAMIRRFSSDVLAYVTPWNGHGYDIVKLFPTKFTMISPVWLQVRPEIDDTAVIEGLHDIDSSWIQSVHQLNGNIKIVPRIIFEQWSYKTLKKFFKNKVAVRDISSKLIKLAKEKDFSGYVVEIWNMLGGQLKKEVTRFLIEVSSTFKVHGLALILVIPPPVHAGGQKGIFDKEDFAKLVDHVTAFSLMTYDYSNYQRPGPNSPLPWIVQCVDELASVASSDSIEHRKKILIGLNFYGYDYSKMSSKPILGHEYISLLEKHKPRFVFSNITGEHSFTYSSDHVDHLVFYPTLYSIQLRIQLARDLGAGISIWELGQGLDYFYDLL